jgi:hypothetical protein
MNKAINMQPELTPLELSLLLLSFIPVTLNQIDIDRLNLTLHEQLVNNARERTS